VRNAWNRPLGSKLILILSLVLLGLFIVAPWQRPCQVRSDPGQPLLCGRTFAWEGSDVGLYAMALVAIILFWELLPVFVARLRARPAAAMSPPALGTARALHADQTDQGHRVPVGWAWVALGVAARSW
jgi:hypothetical protein